MRYCEREKKEARRTRVLCTIWSYDCRAETNVVGRQTHEASEGQGAPDVDWEMRQIWARVVVLDVSVT